jgi:hypothetical protein
MATEADGAGDGHLSERERAELGDRVARARLELEDTEQRAADERLFADDPVEDTSEADYWEERIHGHEQGES